MMPFIIERTDSSETEKRVQMNNGYLARPLSIGSSWNSLRITCLMGVYNPDGNATITGSPKVHIGLCAGPEFARGKVSFADVNHWLGIVTTSPSWTYNAGPPNYFSDTNGGLREHVVDGTSIDIFGLGTTTLQPISNGTYQRKGPFGIIVTKGSPNWTVGRTHVQSSAYGTMTESQFVTYASQATPPAVTGMVWDSNATTVTAPNEAVNGYFDTVNIEVSGLVVAEISAIVVTRLS